jgi:hypothetical protein
MADEQNQQAPTDGADGATGGAAGGAAGGATGGAAGGAQQDSALNRVTTFMMGNKVEAALWLTRMFTVVTSILFFLPIFGGNPSSLYQRVLLSNAATSALRLHQRLPHFQFSREFIGLMFLEDSAHYLFYSLIFVMSYPVTMSLVPVFLFALLHATNYTKSVMNQVGPNSMAPIRSLVAKVDGQQRSILRFIACNEIFMMPMIIFMMFTGNSSLLLPFIYYRFITLRYASRRNPYCRQLFYELRVTTEHLCSKPQCPAFVRNLSFKISGFISNLAPAVPAQ